MDNKNLLIIIVLLLVGTTALSVFNLISTKKYGFIDSSVLLQQFSGAVKAREQLNEQVDEWNSNQKTLKQEIMELNQEIIENNAKWSKSKLLEKRKAFQQKQNDYARYTQATNEKAQAKEKELFNPVYVELNALIQDFAKDKGYDLIWGTVAGGNILYGTDDANLTEEFLKYVQLQDEY